MTDYEDKDEDLRTNEISIHSIRDRLDSLHDLVETIIVCLSNPEMKGQHFCQKISCNSLNFYVAPELAKLSEDLKHAR